MSKLPPSSAVRSRIEVSPTPAWRSAGRPTPGVWEKCLDGQRPAGKSNDTFTSKRRFVRLLRGDNNRAVEVQATEALASRADQRVREHDPIAERRLRLTLRV
jgi:hypothetical protein